MKCTAIHLHSRLPVANFKHHGSPHAYKFWFYMYDLYISVHNRWHHHGGAVIESDTSFMLDLLGGVSSCLDLFLNMSCFMALLCLVTRQTTIWSWVSVHICRSSPNSYFPIRALPCHPRCFSETWFLLLARDCSTPISEESWHHK